MIYLYKSLDIYISYSNDFGDVVVAVINAGSNSVVSMLSVVLMISSDSNFVDM